MRFLRLGLTADDAPTLARHLADYALAGLKAVARKAKASKA